MHLFEPMLAALGRSILRLLERIADAFNGWHRHRHVHRPPRLAAAASGTLRTLADTISAAVHTCTGSISRSHRSLNDWLDRRELDHPRAVATARHPVAQLTAAIALSALAVLAANRALTPPPPPLDPQLVATREALLRPRTTASMLVRVHTLGRPTTPGHAHPQHQPQRQPR